jgi:ribonuclease R
MLIIDWRIYALANKKVAEFIGKQRKLLYINSRWEPNADKLIALQTVIAKFGYKIDLKVKMIFQNHWIVY